MRRLTTMGLVLRATKTGEADRALSILTPGHGVVSAMAKGSLRMKSKLASGTGLFCYSEFVLFEGRSMYAVDAASPQEVFWGLHQSVEGMALAMYLAEFAGALAPAGEEAGPVLRLLLNCFYYLSEHKRPPRLIKAIFELRALSGAGFMPNLVACDDCVKYEGGPFCFDVQRGVLYCAACAAKRGMSPNLDASALAAMRHIVYAPDEKLFAFTLSDESTRALGAVAERYVMQCIDRPFQSQEFLQTVL